MSPLTTLSRLLLVSRDPSALRGVWAVCEANSWQLETASSGLEAIERVETGHVPTLILLDIVPGDSEALHTLRWLRRVGPFIPVVVMSQAEDNRQMMEAVRLGAEDYVLKPLQADGLERVLRRHMLSSRTDQPLDLRADDVEAIGDNFYFLAASAASRRLRARASLLAQVAVPVLITGESGSGRETAARLIHKLSLRSEFPFAKINCSMLAPDVLEKELWSQEFASSGADGRTEAGRSDLYRTGSILLDEVDSLPDALQLKLLDLFQSKQVFKNGGEAARGDLRVMASTSVDAEVLVATGRLREDLWHWLSTFVLQVPSLRERREEVPLLLNHFMNRLSKRYGLPVRRISQDLSDACQRYSWPGNLREMENFVKRYLIGGDESVAKSELQGGPVLNSAASHAGSQSRLAHVVVHNGGNGEKTGLKSLLRTVKGEAEREAIARALDETHWNRKAAARKLNISYRALLYKIQQHQMTPPKTHVSNLAGDRGPNGTSHGE